MDGFYILISAVAVLAIVLEQLGGDKWWGDIKPQKRHIHNSIMPTKRLRPNFTLKLKKWIRDLFR